VVLSHNEPKLFLATAAFFVISIVVPEGLRVFLSSWAHTLQSIDQRLHFGLTTTEQRMIPTSWLIFSLHVTRLQFTKQMRLHCTMRPLCQVLSLQMASKP
jgi:hypothetical protein